VMLQGVGWMTSGLGYQILNTCILCSCMCTRIHLHSVYSRYIVDYKRSVMQT
jgi:hypothetical protein